jgi:glycosyltransferase involved in cell wall biosynthesis
MKPLVSILIPAFNSEKWIVDTLQSAIAQTWQRKEIIIVDDGSFDATLAITRQFESTDVCVVTQENQGAAAARNKALSLSQGDYIQWLDADDLLAPTKIAAQMEILSLCPNNRTLVTSAWGRFMYRYNCAEWIPSALWCDLSPTEWLLRKMGENLFMLTETWLVSRELTAAAGPWNSSLLVDDDGEYFSRVLLRCESIRFVPDARVYYRMSPNSLSHIGFSDRKLDAQLRSMQLQIGYLQSLEDSQRVRAACVKYLQMGLFYFYPERLDIVMQIEKMAVDLGGQLEIPRLSWKYAWIEAVLGRNLAKRVQLVMPQFKRSLVRFFDKVLYHIENKMFGGIGGNLKM